MKDHNIRWLFILTLIFILGLTQFSYFEKNSLWGGISSILAFVSLGIFFKFQKKLQVWSRNPFHKILPVEFNLWSRKVFTDDGEDKEKLLLENLNLKIKAYRLLLSVFIISIGFILLLRFDINLSVYGLILFVFNTVFLVLSSYIGHLLVLGLVNSGFSFVFLNKGDISLLIIQLALFCLLIISFVSIKRNHIFNPIKYLKFFFSVLSLFLIFSFILPDKLSLFTIRKKKETKKEQNIYKQNFSIPSPSKIKISKTHMEAFKQLLNQHENELNLLGNSLSKIPGYSAAEIEKIKNLNLDIQEENNQLKTISFEDGITASDLKEILNRIEKIGKKKLEIAESIEAKIKDTEKGNELYPNTTQEGLLKKIKIENLEGKLEKITDIANKEEENHLFKELRSEVVSANEKDERVVSDFEVEYARESNIKKEELKFEKYLEQLQYLVRAMVLFGILLFFYYLFKRKNSSKEVLDRDIKESMKKSLKIISRLKLSPNQEIIRTYNVFKKLVKEEVFLDDEVPPPVTLYKLLSTEINSQATWSVTDIFCHCYYGDYTASEQDRLAFRAAFKLLLKG